MIQIADSTLKDLEFPKVREQLSSHCLTEKGMEKSLKIRPFKSPGRTLFSLRQTQEYKSSALQDEPIPGHTFDSIDDEIHLLGIQNSVLELRSFPKISAISETANKHLHFFRKHKDLYPCLYKTTEFVEFTPEIVQNIKQVIDRFGEVKNDASPLLLEIRKSLISLQSKIDSSFAADLSAYQSAGYLDEIRESVIENKRVLAVSAMYRRRVKGSILGRSKTGSIVFIQPENTLRFSRELNNLQYEEKEEVNRILKSLTEKIRPYRQLLDDYQLLLSSIDVIAAKVKYAGQMGGILPKITKKKELDLREAYHPLLLLTNNENGRKTYPQDIKLDEDNRIIVISGPNAGGKSITLKTIGLLQVMLQSGLLIPVHEYSRMCLFSQVLSDIGDNQSIENHLSTYSYRLKNMRYFLKKCDEDTLFLIDEFGTGSDPELGGALAETFLEVFFERGSYGVITTHYANLKKMANETEGIINANMRFDGHSLEPEFKLQLGEAGSSFTFEVAQKNGIPYSLINRSRKKVERGKIRFDKSIAKLQKERQKLVKTTKNLQKEEIEVTKKNEEMETLNSRIQQKLEDYQELYDSNQQLIYLGRKFDKLSKDFDKSSNKKLFISELLKLAAIENSKRKKLKKQEEKRKKQHEYRIRKEAEEKLVKIRKEKEIQKKKIEEQKEQELKQRIESLSINDRVKLEGSQAVGTIDRIEKGRAIINYGMFTTEAPLEKIELVSRAK